MAFSPLPSSLEEALKEIKMWRENHRKQRPSRSGMTWLGLTDEDKQAFLNQDFGGSRLDAMDYAEKLLKDKNHANTK